LQQFSAIQAKEATTKEAHRSRAESLVIVGLVFSTTAFVMFFATNGDSGVSSTISLVILILIALGLFSPAAGMFLLGRKKSLPRSIRRSFDLQGIGLASLFFAVILAVSSGSLEFFLGSAAIVAASASFVLVGTIILRTNASRTGSKRIGDSNLLVIGMLLLFAGAVLIIAFNILEATFYVPIVAALMYEDIGSTLSAYGCVLGSYSFLHLLKE
jgi:hypothetical protein